MPEVLELRHENLVGEFRCTGDAGPNKVRRPCGSTLRVFDDDLYRFVYPVYMEYPPCVYFECPVCGAFTQFSTYAGDPDLLPKHGNSEQMTENGVKMIHPNLMSNRLTNHKRVQF